MMFNKYQIAAKILAAPDYAFRANYSMEQSISMGGHVEERIEFQVDRVRDTDLIDTPEKLINLLMDEL